MGMAQQQKPSSWMNNPPPQSYSMSVQIGIRATRNPLSSRERHQRANVPLLNLQLNVLCRLLVCSADIFSAISSIIQFVCELLHKHLRSPGFFWFISQCPGYGLGLNVGCGWYRSFQERLWINAYLPHFQDDRGLALLAKPSLGMMGSTHQLYIRYMLSNDNAESLFIHVFPKGKPLALWPKGLFIILIY